MLRVGHVREIIQQFPWGKVETDGTTDDKFVPALHDVLGDLGFGFWSRRDTERSHITTATHIPPGLENTFERKMAILRKPAASDYIEGYHLLDVKLPCDEAGWLLDRELIPILHFESTDTLPKIATDVAISSWAEWYAWRRLPLKSPVALLMNYPLSVYYLLTDVLNVIRPEGRSSSSPKKLMIHYVGAEIELIFLPM